MDPIDIAKFITDNIQTNNGLILEDSKILKIKILLKDLQSKMSSDDNKELRDKEAKLKKDLQDAIKSEREKLGLPDWEKSDWEAISPDHIIKALFGWVKKTHAHISDLTNGEIDFTPELFIKSLEHLGTGVAGVVFSLDDDKVIKVSRAERDYKNAKQAMDFGGECEHLPKIYYVEKLPQEENLEKYYNKMLNEIPNLPEPWKSIIKAHGKSTTNFFELYLTIAEKISTTIPKELEETSTRLYDMKLRHTKIYKQKDFNEYYKEVIKRLGKRNENEWTKKLLEAIWDVYEKTKIDFSNDIHHDNIGLRDNTIVFFDFSHANIRE